MKRLSSSQPKITFAFWRSEGKHWYAERSDLEAAIRSSEHSEEALKRRLGAGYNELLQAMDGKRLTGWTVSHIEWGLGPECSA